MYNLYKKITFLIAVASICILHSVSSEGISSTACTQESSAEGNVTVKCLCPASDDTLIVRDERRVVSGSGAVNITLPSNTTHWSLGGCQAVHLSGQTLASLSRLHTLHLHNTSVIHVGYDFFMQINTPLQTLRFSNSSFAELEDFLNIHAHKIQVITLDNMILNGTFRLIITTQEGIVMDRISITNSYIDILGEINLSSRNITKFVLANNTIGNILTGAIMHASSHTFIQGNTISNLSFLALDTTTNTLTLTGNTVQNLAMQGLAISKTTTLTITNNSFYCIERFGLAWIRSKHQDGSMTFTHNHFYEHGNGSLIFYFSAYNKNLIVDGNTFHTNSCTCDILRNMTERNDTVEIDFKMDIFQAFKDTSTCLDAMGKETSMASLCKEDEKDDEWNIALITIAFVTLGIIVAMVLVRCYYKDRYRKLVNEKEDYHYMIGEWVDDN